MSAFTLLTLTVSLLTSMGEGRRPRKPDSWPDLHVHDWSSGGGGGSLDVFSLSHVLNSVNVNDVGFQVVAFNDSSASKSGQTLWKNNNYFTFSASSKRTPPPATTTSTSSATTKTTTILTTSTLLVTAESSPTPLIITIQADVARRHKSRRRHKHKGHRR